jgi:hypothetical protein
MINVTSHPNVDGDGSNDDSDGLQELITDAEGALYFPPGQYRITKTLVFPPKTGYHIIGTGMVSKENPGNRAMDAAIVWDPEPATAGTIIEYQGTGLVWNGLALWGRPHNTTQTRAAIGLKIAKPLAGTLDTGNMWLPAIRIDDCETGVYAFGALSAASCAFGYAFMRGCETCFHLDGANATIFTFRYIHPLSSKKVFIVEAAGRIYVHAINIVEGPETILRVNGGTEGNSFFHIGGLKMDSGNPGFRLVDTDDETDTLTHIRFTDAHFTGDQNNVVDVRIDRRGGNGQTVLEFVGCKGVANGGKVLASNVQINGGSASTPSRLIVRDSELALRSVVELIDPSSQHYTENRLKNWVFSQGIQTDESSSG